MPDLLVCPSQHGTWRTILWGANQFTVLENMACTFTINQSIKTNLYSALRRRRIRGACWTDHFTTMVLAPIILEVTFQLQMSVCPSAWLHMVRSRGQWLKMTLSHLMMPSSLTSVISHNNSGRKLLIGVSLIGVHSRCSLETFWISCMIDGLMLMYWTLIIWLVNLVVFFKNVSISSTASLGLTKSYHNDCKCLRRLKKKCKLRKCPANVAEYVKLQKDTMDKLSKAEEEWSLKECNKLLDSSESVKWKIINRLTNQSTSVQVQPIKKDCINKDEYAFSDHDICHELENYHIHKSNHTNLLESASEKHIRDKVSNLIEVAKHNSNCRSH